jgi:hypothetical protein
MEGKVHIRKMLPALVFLAAILMVWCSPADAKNIGRGKRDARAPNHGVLKFEKHKGGKSAQKHSRKGDRKASKGKREKHKRQEVLRGRGEKRVGSFRPSFDSNTSRKLRFVLDDDADGLSKFDGLPPGLGKRSTLPPGLAKRDELPPGLAKYHRTPPGLAKMDDLPPGLDKD